MRLFVGRTIRYHDGKHLGLARGKNAVPTDDCGRHPAWADPRHPVLAERNAPQTWDLLTLHTDGISESTNEAAEELGYGGLMSLVRNLPAQTVNSPTRSVKFCSRR